MTRPIRIIDQEFFNSQAREREQTLPGDVNIYIPPIKGNEQPTCYLLENDEELKKATTAIGVNPSFNSPAPVHREQKQPYVPLLLSKPLYIAEPTGKIIKFSNGDCSYNLAYHLREIEKFRIGFKGATFRYIYETFCYGAFPLFLYYMGEQTALLAVSISISILVSIFIERSSTFYWQCMQENVIDFEKQAQNKFGFSVFNIGPPVAPLPAQPGGYGSLNSTYVTADEKSEVKIEAAENSREAVITFEKPAPKAWYNPRHYPLTLLSTAIAVTVPLVIEVARQHPLSRNTIALGGLIFIAARPLMSVADATYQWWHYGPTKPQV